MPRKGYGNRFLSFPLDPQYNARAKSTIKIRQLIIDPEVGSLGFWTAFLNFFDIERIGCQYLTLQSSHRLFCLIFPAHLDNPFSLAKARERVDDDSCIIHPAKRVKKPLKIKLIKMPGKTGYCHSHKTNIACFSRSFSPKFNQKFTH